MKRLLVFLILFHTTVLANVDGTNQLGHDIYWNQIFNSTGAYMSYKPNGAVCSNNQILTWSNAFGAWLCADNTGSGGTVTEVDTGSGLTGGPITTTGTVSCNTSNASTFGCLTSTDWSTFNGKQAAGNYITALTGDGTASGPGSAALTLATVNSNVGSFGDASHSLSITVNGKGLTTAASTNSIQIAESQVTNLVSDLAGKQPAGNYITALTGDVTASGPGSVASTLATVNANTGSFGDATHVGAFTVNGKGLITAASSTAITFPAAVTSVAMTVPGTIYSISGSPITSSGTLALSLLTQTANTVFSGPTTGSAATPTFRSLVAADIPSLDAGKITTGQLALARGGTGVDLSATGGTSQVLKQNSSHVISVAQLAASDLSNGTNGTGAVTLTDSPAFTTKITTPKLLGGTGTTQTLTYQTTSGVGATGADHIFLVGNAGATEAMRILNSGAVAIGTSSPDTGRLFDVNGQTGFRGLSVWSSSGTTSGVIGPGDLIASGGTSSQLGVAGLSDLLFLSNGTGSAAKMILKSSGFFGVGTTSPGDLVDVSSTVAADGSTPTALRISGLLSSNAWTAGAAVANLDFYNNDSGGSGGAGVRTRLSTVTEDTLGNNWALAFLTSASNAAATEKMRISSTGRVGVGVTSPTADLHLKAGTATASTAPLKFTSGTLLTSAEAGASEYDGTNFYLTNSTPTRKGIIQNGGNSFGAAETIGTTDNNVLTFQTNGAEVARLDTGGFFGVGATNLIGQIEAAGPISDASWTSSGKKLIISSNTLTDTSSTAGATIATRVASSFSRPTYAATNAITITNAANLYIAGEPAAGTNVTITNPISLEVVRGVTYLAGNTGMGTAAPDSQLEVDGTVHLGTAGTIFTNMGTCTVASAAWTLAPTTGQTCTGVTSSATYVFCSGATPATGQTFDATATAANTVTIVASAVGTSALRCMFITP